MNTYTIRELQNVNSQREGETVTAKDLSAAKRIASRNQFYQGTVLVVEAANGNRLAVKQNGRWA